MSEYIPELKKVSKSFSGVEVLHEVSFALRPGEVQYRREKMVATAVRAFRPRYALERRDYCRFH
jgi:hypothetical protein